MCLQIKPKRKSKGANQMNAQQEKNVFRPFNDNDWFDFMGCEENPHVMDTSITIDGVKHEHTKIVIDGFNESADKIGVRVGLYVDMNKCYDGYTCYIGNTTVEAQIERVKSWDLNAITTQFLKDNGFTFYEG